LERNKMRQVLVDEDEKIIKVNDFLTIILNDEKFSATGEVAVDYDEKVLTNGEALEIVNEYFVRLMRLIQKKAKTL